ncbi:MAG: hypothetical protein IJ457_02325 [Clostridia bacterium]|nr:hypothetical protein [Clostridia bacterium]
MTHDFSTADGRKKIFEYLYDHEAANDRRIRLGKIKNIIITLIFAFNSLIYISYVVDLFVGAVNFDKEHLTALPVFDRVLPFVAGYTNSEILKTILFGFVFLVLVPIVCSIALHIILSIFIRKHKAQPEAFPEDEEAQMKAIVEKEEKVQAKADSYEAPYGKVSGAAVINTIAVFVLSAVILVRESAPLSFLSWVLFIVAGIVLMLIMLGVSFLSFMSFTVTTSSGIKDALSAYEIKLELERAERKKAEEKALKEEEARKEKERIDAMSADELYEYASMLEDDDIKLKYLHIAEKRGSKDAPFLIDVIYKSREEERYKRSRRFMDEGWEAQRRGNYRSAQQKFYAAACLDNPDGMYNYARLCLKFHERRDAVKWLEKAIASGTYDDDDTNRILAAIKRGEHINVVD